MGPKWFSQSDDGLFNGRFMSSSANVAEISSSKRPRAMSRVSSSFSDHRNSRGPSDRTSSSSWRRHSFFGRNSMSSSSTATPDAMAKDFASHSQPQPRPQTASSRESYESTAGREHWRSSIFTRKGLGKQDDSVMRWMRSSIGPAFDHKHRDEDSAEAFYGKRDRMVISRPYDFKHVAHTQLSDHAPAGDIYDPELISLGHPHASSAGQLESNGESEVPFSFARGPLAGMTFNQSRTDLRDTQEYEEADKTRLMRSSSDLVAPPQNFSRSNLMRSMSSTERHAAPGVDPRLAPTLLHPALRSPPDNGPSFDGWLQSTGPTDELAVSSLASVPEELEGAGVSPARPMPRRSTLDRSKHMSSVSGEMVFTPFPKGNAFAQSCGGAGAEIAAATAASRMSFSGLGINSNGQWDDFDHDIDFSYLVEAEASCDFDWSSLRSSQKDSETSHGASSSTLSLSGEGNAQSGVSTRPSSQRTSARSVEGACFADFDSCSPCVSSSVRRDSPQPPATPATPHTALAQVVPASQPLECPPSGLTRFSSTGISMAELSPIPESCVVTISSSESSSETVIGQNPPKHARSLSLETQDREIVVGKQMTRWSFASPACLPKNFSYRPLNFTKRQPQAQTARMSVIDPNLPPPSLPPPTSALPPLPIPNPAHLLSPPLTPENRALPQFSTLRNSSSPQDRALLQKAGHFVQRGRNFRVSTPSRLCKGQTPPLSYPVRPAPPMTPPRPERLQFEQTLFPTPPSSPPDMFHDNAYPAWI